MYILLSLLFISGVAFAAQTGTTLWHRHSYVDNNSYVDKYSDYELKRGNPLGIGLDAVIYEFEGRPQIYGLDNVEIQQRWDMNNQEYQLFGVMKVNAFRAIQNLLK